jgi:hypothetical protein
LESFYGARDTGKRHFILFKIIANYFHLSIMKKAAGIYDWRSLIVNGSSAMIDRSIGWFVILQTKSPLG